MSKTTLKDINILSCVIFLSGFGLFFLFILKPTLNVKVNFEGGFTGEFSYLINRHLKFLYHIFVYKYLFL